MIRLGDPQVRGLLTPALADDPAFGAAGSALETLLRRVVRSVPNLLLWHRLALTAGRPVPGMLAPIGRVAEASGGLTPLSTAELERLAWQLHVDFRETARTDAELAGLILDAIAWHRIKGTPASLYAALRRFGYAAAIEENGPGAYWATYQLGLPQIADMDDVRRIVTICTEMAPARCRLWRMYTDAYDRRPIVLSEGPALGDGWLSFHSGVSVEGPDGDIVVSFGTKRSFQAETYLPSLHAASFGTECVSGHTAPYLDRFIVGRSRLSDPLPRNHPFVMGALFSILWADRQTLGRSWRGEWDARRWLDYTGFDRKLPRWRMGRRSLSRAQLVPTESMLADTNSRLGATFAVVIDNPPRLGSFTLSGHECGREERRLHEMAIVTQGTETPRLDPPAPQAAGTAWLASAGGIPDPERVQQASQCDLAMKLAENAWTPPETALPSSLALTAAPLDPAPPFAAGTGLLSVSGSPLPEVEPEHGILSAQALSMKSTAWAAPESAGLSALGTGTPSLAPAPPASGLLTLFAPQWAGAWTQTGQDWKTPSHITIQ